MALRSVLTRLGWALRLSLVALLLLRLRLRTGLSARLGLGCFVFDVIVGTVNIIRRLCPVVFGITGVGTPFGNINGFTVNFQPFDG